MKLSVDAAPKISKMRSTSSGRPDEGQSNGNTQFT